MINWTTFWENVIVGASYAIGASIAYMVLYFFFGTKGKGLRKYKINFK